jgi:DNA-binding NtrC family response regulator
MEPSTSPIAALAELFDGSRRPMYAIDARRQILYCNAALADWLGLEPTQIVGRYVEYHSEPAAESQSPRPAASPLAGLCPPPRTLAGEQSVGTVGCVGRGGRLVHRHADFLPLSTASGQAAHAGQLKTGDGALDGGVFVVLAAADMSAQELSAELSAEPSSDELHRVIRSFRRRQSADYAIDSLLGESSAMRRVRAQVAAAAASQANVLIRGRRGSGRGHVARAIHYQAPTGTIGRLLLFDCEVASEDLLRRTLDSLAGVGSSRVRDTLLVTKLDQLPQELQSQLLVAVRNSAPHARFVATLNPEPSRRGRDEDETVAARSGIAQSLVNSLSTITIDVPRLADRLEDLPLLAQCFLESLNCGSAKQVGSVSAETLDLMAMYRWPGELDELRSVITAAHAACSTHEFSPADLPPVVHHAARAAALPRRAEEDVVLDELLASIEREVITRAMAQADGNKAAAAKLLGMTRPRLYRRLVQLDMIQHSEGNDVA